MMSFVHFLLIVFGIHFYQERINGIGGYGEVEKSRSQFNQWHNNHFQWSKIEWYGSEKVKFFRLFLDVVYAYATEFRSSTAPHRSLPDIPISEPPAGDTGSDLYATVGDKVAEKPQGRSRKEFFLFSYPHNTQSDCSNPF